MKMHKPTSPNKAFEGKSHLGNYSDKMIEMDDNIGRIMDAIRAEAPNTIVIHHGRQWRVAGRMARRRHQCRSAVKRARRSKAVSACPASCGGRGTFLRCPLSTK